MMDDPNVFTLNLEQMLSGEPIDTAIGVLQVTVQSARDLKGSKLGGGRPDRLPNRRRRSDCVARRQDVVSASVRRGQESDDDE